MKENNLIFASLKETEEKIDEMNKSDIPAGYIEISLSTKGKLGAPKVFHIRNFKVKDVISLSLTDDTNLPNRLIKVLNSMIYEDVDVSDWHEKEIEELMVYVYMTFFNGVILDMPFTVTEEDRQWLRDHDKKNILEDIDNKKWTPRTDIDIASGVDTYDLPEDYDPNITITNKKTGFFVTFGYVKYGDQLKIKRWLDSYFADKEKKFEKYKKAVEYNNSIMYRLQDDPSLLDKTIDLDPEETEAYNEYTSEKLEVLTDIVKIISVTNYNGMDVTKMSLSDKYELLSQDARIDVGMINKLTKRQNKYQFGIKPEVKMRNPITGGVVSRPFTFRLSTILSAIQLSGDDEYDDGYDDED